MSDCKRCYWYKNKECTNKYSSKDFDYYYNHMDKDCKDYEEA